ncbi:hypothetical protein BCS96_06495 [Vibrio breoganii]|uniref:hypothetical protein n=1 Tax=Vibrio breoganii TaxID=553239 RepID=UPI000C830B53|nr:hypothetical protein [Vibrio breoganii]PMF63940.1 hypothetical protein BCV08_04010 [Vibrio breoganii]PMG05907.1 hypothetical protein BCV00_11385 [Vibrio breoganii]PMG36110.1 hypothetical protein BCU93_16835 [Vibrio breoganii]PMG90404.1 hypothetical protein BCU80_14810 [Vibrio breoganii]PMG90806.1 hypothetical protein BCU81_05450 [Vibrio breoganii]
MFKNKHFIVALLVAPILAVITYFGIDMAVSEKPHAAKQGESYKLISKSNCRYTSGLCDFENGEFKVQFRSEKLTADTLELSLRSKFPLQGIKVALAENGESQPIEMTPTNQDMRNWAISLPASNIETKNLRVAIQAEDTLYYGETETTFVVYETLFTEDK